MGWSGGWSIRKKVVGSAGEETAEKAQLGENSGGEDVEKGTEGKVLGELAAEEVKKAPRKDELEKDGEKSCGKNDKSWSNESLDDIWPAKL